MKEGWDRRVALLDLDLAALGALVQPVWPGRKVVAAASLSGGLANTLYRVEIAGVNQPVVIRLYTRDRAACQKDLDLWTLLGGHIPLPELFYADPAGAIGGTPYAIMELVAGPTLEAVLMRGDEAEIEAAMYQVGATRAALAAFTFEQSGFFGPGLRIAQPIGFGSEPFLAFIGGCLFDGGGAECLGPARAEQVWKLVNTHAALLDTLPPVHSLVHADFNGPNILLGQRAGQWHVAALIDWEFAFAGPLIYDLGIMLRHATRFPPVFATAFERGLTDHGVVLGSDWKPQARLLDLMNLCQFLTIATGDSQMARDVRALIAAMIEDWARNGVG